jgi:hypothetical protein
MLCGKPSSGLAECGFRSSHSTSGCASAKPRNPIVLGQQEQVQKWNGSIVQWSVRLLSLWTPWRGGRGEASTRVRHCTRSSDASQIGNDRVAGGLDAA